MSYFLENFTIRDVHPDQYFYELGCIPQTCFVLGQGGDTRQGFLEVDLNFKIKN